MENEKIYCCLEHIELALDMAVDEFETAPAMEKIEDEIPCEFCKDTAIYMVGK